MKLKKLGLILAVMMVITSISGTVFAEKAEDAVIFPSADSLGSVNPASGTSEENVIVKSEVYDSALCRNVLKFETPSYTVGGGSVGNEQRIWLIDSNGASLGGLNYSNGSYDYLRMEFDIYIEDEYDGIAFRMGRYDSATGEFYKTSDGKSLQDFYFAVGGSSYPGSTVTYGYTAVNKTLDAGAWNHVVMEIGASTDVRTVKYYINNAESEVAIKPVTNKVTGTAVEALPEGTYGFGGSTQNRCVLILRGKSNEHFEIRLDGFSVKATNTAYVPSTESELFSKCVYKMENDTFVGRNVVTADKNAAAPHFAAGYKTAILHTIPAGSSTKTSAGQEPIYTMLDAPGSVGGVDWLKYKNLRLQFNIYIEESTDSLYFRVLRTANGTAYDKTYQYVFNIGGEDSHIPTIPATGTNITYKGLSTGRWHNVVMELGANKDNNYIRYYVDGEAVTPSMTSFTDADTAYGYGGTSTSFAVISMRNKNKAAMNMYLSDFEAYASTTEYNPSNDAVPKITDTLRTSSFKVDGGSVISASALTPLTKYENIFAASNADYIGSATESRLIAYNSGSKRITYKDVTVAEAAVDGKLYAENIVLKSDTNVRADAHNTSDTAASPKIVVAYYNGTTLADAKLVSISMNAGETKYINETVAAPSAAYDRVKAFVWNGLDDGMVPLGINAEK